jgi:hypothetical protein
VHIFNVRKEPKVRFLADPWDLFEDGQLILENSRKYKAKLNLRLRRPTKGNSADTGFDFVQIREHEEDEMDKDEGPKEEQEKGKAVERKMRKVEFGEAQPGDNAGRTDSARSAGI